MLLTLHVMIAVTALLVSVVSALIPRSWGLTMAKITSVSTAISGVALALINSVSLIHLCASGSVVISICAALIYYTNRKLAFAKQS